MSPPEETPAQTESEPAPPAPPTPDEEHEARLKADPKGRCVSMIDLILRGCGPSEFEELATALRPFATKAQGRL